MKYGSYILYDDKKILFNKIVALVRLKDIGSVRTVLYSMIPLRRFENLSWLEIYHR